jgi:hypothetical protein
MASEENGRFPVAVDKYHEMSANDNREDHHDYGPYIEPSPLEAFQPSFLPRSNSADLITPAPVYLSRPPNSLFRESEYSIASYESRDSSVPGSPLPGGRTPSDDSHEMLAALNKTEVSAGRHHCQRDS